MSHHEFDSTDTKKFTLTAFLSFVTVFFFLMIMMNCSGSFKPGGAEHEATKAHDTESAEHAAPVPAVAEHKAESIKVKLPDGTELNAYKGGIEDKLVAFLNDTTAKVSKDTWFDFDNLNFKSASAEITPESHAQIQNIAAILKAYPKVKIKIGGYTDKTGDDAANQKLSQDRANATVEALKGHSVNAAQLTGAEGYGSQFAKAAATAPDEEKQKDRRISVSVREK
jgi:outer membrane protein OmpA-like peptidoglycan-associated protein